MKGPPAAWQEPRLKEFLGTPPLRFHNLFEPSVTLTGISVTRPESAVTFTGIRTSLNVVALRAVGGQDVQGDALLLEHAHHMCSALGVVYRRIVQNDRLRP